MIPPCRGHRHRVSDLRMSALWDWLLAELPVCDIHSNSRQQKQEVEQKPAILYCREEHNKKDEPASNPKPLAALLCSGPIPFALAKSGSGGGSGRRQPPPHRASHQAVSFSSASPSYPSSGNPNNDANSNNGNPNGGAYTDVYAHPAHPRRTIPKFGPTSSCKRWVLVNLARLSWAAYKVESEIEVLRVVPRTYDLACSIAAAVWVLSADLAAVHARETEQLSCMRGEAVRVDEDVRGVVEDIGARHGRRVIIAARYGAVRCGACEIWESVGKWERNVNLSAVDAPAQWLNDIMSENAGALPRLRLYTVDLLGRRKASFPPALRTVYGAATI
ncbi:hypothetical protein C8F04DRAFT_1303068 [Mycena alexandri]|uniref:Uncharacterized protein n=1 Tax=Mycena alexandri TaxID=1745969 RepID=A0AAD6SBX3_9AGAR|nr:hypothetical protein C8F04DRAFT_1303068 [Mycena alexandri]